MVEGNTVLYMERIKEGPHFFKEFVSLLLSTGVSNPGPLGTLSFMFYLFLC